MGATVGSHYEVLEKIGEGGYGVVYKARDLHVPRFIALKFIYPHLLTSQPALSRFQHEAHAVSTLSHPNIVVLHDFDTDPDTGRIFLALEYLGGGSLTDFIRRRHESGPKDPLALLHCAIQMASGLGHAHRHHIVHRDVKPSNVLFTQDGTAKITDFGLAKSDQPSAVTDSGHVLGTVYYMSPEQARGLAIDHRTDIFSLGIVLYEMAAGSLPFTGSSEYEVAQKIISEPIPTLNPASISLPEEFNQIVRRATAKDPADRYQDMRELERELLVVEHRLKTLTQRSTTTVQQVAPKRAGRRPVIVVALIALLIVIAGMVWFRLTRRPATAQAPAPRLLAVVPFTCLGDAQPHTTFCEGLANTLSTKFTQMESFDSRVLVIPHADVRSEGVASTADARRIFNANLVLTGSVEFVGDIVRVIVNLVDAEKTVQIDSRKLDASTDHLVSLQDEASELAASMLQIRVSAVSQERVHAGETKNAQAFKFYLQGVGELGGDPGDATMAASLLEQAVKLDPSYALAHAWLGEAYLRQYQTTENGAWLDRARASCGRALTIDRVLPEAHIVVARLWLARTEPEWAAQEAKLALETQPRNAEALRSLGNAYAELARRDPSRKQQAIDTFQEAIALRPELWTTYRDLGLAYYRMGDNKNAEQQFLTMLRYTQSPDAYRRLGVLYHKMDRPQDAIAYLKKSIAVKPTPEAYTSLGAVYYFLQRYEETIPNFERALGLSDPNSTRNHVIWGNLAYAYMETPGLEAKGRDAYRTAVRIAEAKLRASPNHADTHASLAYYLARLGDASGARSHVAEALRLAPDSASILFRCSLVFERLNRRDQALDTLQRAIQHGQPMTEVLNAGELAALRQDARFQNLIQK